ncbi:MAG: DNA methylase [Lachnospiraceae bacterium]|nr:DNA methylase [Lachnospiraceae bacterium]
MEQQKTYIAIDLKSFYASVECRERGLDPLKAKLVVADSSRTDKTICLAVSPELKRYGIPGRPRLFEVKQKAKQLHLDFITAPPRMRLYMEYSTRIFEIYLRYIAPEDMHVYSVDECFMDVTGYLNTYQMTAEELARKMIEEVLDETGITATAGIGTNMYLCKIAMDVVAKHMPADENGVRIASLDEMSYRRLLWDHKPITDFWRVGRGYGKKLAKYGMYTMGDVARCSVGGEDDYYNEELLYKLFGVNAELLIDHAWGYEPCTIAEIKAYRPESNSLSQGQVLQRPYEHREAAVIVKEMSELLALDLVDKRLVTNQLVLTIGYDIENIKDEKRRKNYKGEVVTDSYGRLIPKHGHGTKNLPYYNSSSKMIIEKMSELFEEITDPSLLVRRVTVVANNVITEKRAEHEKKESYEQLTIFDNFEEKKKEEEDRKKEQEKERSLQRAMLSIKNKYGKNAILRGTNFEEGAMTIERNNQVGGHKA